MKIALTIITALVVTSITYGVWLRAGITSTEWAIELIGGHDNLEKKISTASEDSLFLKSLDYDPDITQSIAILSNTPCYAQDEKCLDNNLAKANVLAITGKDFSTAQKLIQIYSNTLPSACQLKIELSQLVYETARLVKKPNQHTANTLLAKIKNNGGLNHTINNTQCHTYISSRPYLAKAYLFYLATLMSMSDFSPESGWIYLLYKSGYRT